MADIAGVVVSAILEVGKWLAVPIWRQSKYLYNYTTNFKNLEKEVDKLKNTRVEVQHKVTAAERDVEEIKQNVKNWQKDVEKTIIEAEQLIQEKANNPRCFKGLCPNFIIHYKQSKKAFKLKRDDIDPLLQQEKDLDPVSYPTNPPEIWRRSSENYLAFKSRNSTAKNVWDALNDENAYMIGVYGMGGLGKTTLVEELGRKAEKDKLFEDIVFVEVSESPDVKKIQTTIAKKLGLKFENENESEMADKIYSRMKDKNILLILDNIWEPLELDRRVGIPRRADRGRNKLLFTTRNLDVLQRMGSTNNFPMDILNEEEAWTLFTKMAGNIIETSELHSLPNDICKECKGLPIVICTIAKALKNKSHPYDWNYALQELRAPSPAKFTRFLGEDYTKIALSYEYLRNDELKKTFLISNLMENNTSISDLFKHVVCLDVFDRANLTMEEARYKLDKLVCDLKNACLLLDGFQSGQFAMHEVVRVVAMTIAYVDHHVFTPRNDIEREWKDTNKLKKCTMISLPGNSNIISQLWPNNFDCPNLEYFHMWNFSSKIPKDFFTKMPKLRVLSLDRLQQSSLPSSIDLLANLQTLCLDYSKVEDVVVIGRLKKLQVLSLQYSYIKEFPMEMGQLTQLRLLDLSYCHNLKVIAPNVILKFSQLEELYLKGCCIQWKIEVLAELKILSSLSRLELDIEDEKVVPIDFFSRELIRYNISVGDWSFKYSLFGEHEHLRMLELIINPTINLEKLCVIKNVELLRLAEYLDDEDEDENEDEDEDDLEPSKFNLQSNEITPLFNKKVIFPDLKVLVLKNIISRKIWDNQLPSSSFENLKELTLWRCTKIKFVFPYTITKNLQQLQYLEIKDCIDLEEIVATEEIAKAATSFVFPELTFLKLENLLELATFYPGIHTLECPKLKKLVVKNCDKFKMLNSEPNSLCLDHKVHFCDLEVLELENVSFEKIWDSQLSTSSYQNLAHLTLCKCDKIKYVFPLSIAKSLQQLQYLELTICKVLERIVAPEEGTEAAINFFFPQVSTVKLQYLPEFTDFYLGVHTSEWPKLEELVVKDCPKFKIFTSEPNFLCFDQKINHDLEVFKLETQSMVISWYRNSKLLDISSDESAYIPLPVLQRFQSLEELRLYDCEYKEIKSVFDLPNLSVLWVQRCSKLVSLVPSSPSTARSLVQLKELGIWNCGMLAEILENKGDATTIEIVFQKLTKLSLNYLESLTCFCSGNHSLNFPSLEELIITKCPNMDTFFREISNVSEFTLQSNEITPFFNQKVIFPNLKVLKLENISPGKIWNNQFSISSYENLTHLTLFECNKIKYAFPLSIAKSLQQLQCLQLMRCNVLEIIVAPEEGIEAAVNFSFPQVTKVKLQDLPKFTDFYSGIHTSKWPKLKKLVVKDCHKFKMFTSEPNSLCLDQKINHDLEIFKLEDGREEICWRSQSKKLEFSFYKFAHISLWLHQRFENLMLLNVDNCNKLVNLTTPSTARSLVQLRELKISNCDMLMEILEIEEDATTEIVFENLNKLSFERIKNLTCFCSGNYTFNFHSLEVLNIANCPNMKTFCRAILSTPKLQKISYERREVENEGNDLNKTIQGLYKKENQDISLDLNLKCKTFHHYNSIEIGYNQHPTSFYQNLTHLLLWNCENIKYAFPSSIVRSLQQLQQLKIQNCRVLEGIVAKEDGAKTVVHFVFPNITLLELKDLPELTTFYPGIYTLEMPKLKELVVKDCTKYVSLKENNVETELNILDPKFIFLDNKINFNLEVFDGETNIGWLSQSKTLTIDEDISINIPLRLLQRFGNVRELQLSWSQYKDIKSLCDLPNLEILKVNYCYRLMSLVPFSGSFQNLKVLKVSSCNRLIMKLITSSMARSLVQLRELSISNCEMLTEIVENEGDAATCTEIAFNNLNKLSLEFLRSLTCFCSGNYSFSFPSLEELRIDNCFNLEIFCQGSLCTPKLDKVIYEFNYGNVREIEIGDNDLNTTIQQRHKKQVGSCWKKMTLNGRNIMTTLQGEFQEKFGKVETLRLIKDDHAYIRIHILEKFINLEKLKLTVSSYEEIFSCEEGEELVGALSKLKDLRLQGLFNLKCIWKQDFWFKSILQNLHSLNVEHCHNLMTLLPSPSSFKNLMILKVEYCSGMQNLMTSSTAKSLVCLENLSIEGCEMMIEVLADEGDIEKDEIVFERLKELRLFNLESLTYFYYGNYTLKFPFLEFLIVGKCSKMNTFSREVVNMPRLQRVNGTNCSNDLNYVTTQLQDDCSKVYEKFPW